MLKNANFNLIDSKSALISQMTTQQITYFLALAEELHYWQTSYKLNITQSTLSRQIKMLEDELNIELFKRTKRRVELTVAGLFLQKQLQPLEAQLNAAIRYAQKISQGTGGTVIINHPGSVSYDTLPDLLSKVAQLYPNVKVELVQLKHEQEVEFLQSFKLDLAYSRYLHKADFLSSKLVMEDHLAVVIPEDHVIQNENDLVVDILQAQRFILPTLQPGSSYPEIMKQVFLHYGVTPEIYFESDFGSTILGLVERGLGISIMPYSFSATHHPGVRFIKIPFTIPLYVYWRREEENVVVRNILELI